MYTYWPKTATEGGGVLLHKEKWMKRQTECLRDEEAGVFRHNWVEELQRLLMILAFFFWYFRNVSSCAFYVGDYRPA